MAELDDIRTALNLPHLSPSAPYDLRRIAMEKAERANQSYADAGYLSSQPWWEVYPEGHMAAAIFRVLKIIGKPGYEIKGSELPDLPDAHKARIAQLERVREAAQMLMGVQFFATSDFGQINDLRAALAAVEAPRLTENATAHKAGKE